MRLLDSKVYGLVKALHISMPSTTSTFPLPSMSALGFHLELPGTDPNASPQMVTSWMFIFPSPFKSPFFVGGAPAENR